MASRALLVYSRAGSSIATFTLQLTSTANATEIDIRIQVAIRSGRIFDSVSITVTFGSKSRRHVKLYLMTETQFMQKRGMQKSVISA